jgi:hypothetical protein
LGLLSAAPGLALIGFGVALLVICAFYDEQETEVDIGRLGIPTVRVRSRKPVEDEASDSADEPRAGERDDEDE